MLNFVRKSSLSIKKNSQDYWLYNIMSIERLELSRLSAREPKSRASTKFRHMDKFVKNRSDKT